MSLAATLYRVAGAIIPRLPPPWGYALCRGVGRLIARRDSQTRRNIARNIRYALGEGASEAEIQQRTQAAFQNLLYNYYDLFRLPHLDDETVRRLVTIDGWENIEAALAHGRGVVMTSAHFGNMEVVLYEMIRRGLAITIPVERVEPPDLFAYITHLRMSKGLKLIPIDGPLLDLIRDLKKGRVVGLAGDRDITESGQVVEFLGQPAHLPDGHVRLAVRTETPLVVGFSRRNPDQTYHAYFLPPYFPTADTSDTIEADVTAGMQYIIREMEKAIRHTPEQWTVTVSIWAKSHD